MQTTELSDEVLDEALCALVKIGSLASGCSAADRSNQRSSEQPGDRQKRAWEKNVDPQIRELPGCLHWQKRKPPQE
ncbi:MAG: hypothetical protein KAR25_05710 [Methanosarcinales archaeon]|nr:hypothetical protein [Methanosarcinales archaeon]